MAIATYKELKDSATRWLNKSDPALVAEIPNCVNFAEKEIYRNMRIPPFEHKVELTVTSGGISIPSNLLKFKSVYADNIGFLSPTSVDNIFNTSMSFAREHEVIFFSRDIPEGTKLSVVYYVDQKELVNDDDTNDLLIIAPDLLLYTTLKHAAIFDQNNDDVAKFNGLAQAAYQSIVAQSDDFDYSGGTMHVQNHMTFLV